MNKNPFITSGYVSADYFCDREEESKEIIRDIEGRNNKVIISPRRMGKTGLILHCFQQPELHEHYYCFFYRHLLHPHPVRLHRSAGK